MTTRNQQRSPAGRASLDDGAELIRDAAGLSGHATTSVTIDAVVVRVLKADIDAPVPMSFSALGSRRSLVVEVHGDGLVGIGESWVNYPTWAWVERVATIREGVAALLVGTSVADAGAVHALLAERLGPLGRQWGAPGPIWQAISGLDTALWDLLGKASGRSVAEMLGGRTRELAPVYASGVGPDSVEQLTEKACADGYTALKVKVGFGRERDEATLRGVREVAGDELRLFSDANQAWTLDEAVEMCHLFRAFGVEWCEEPVAGDDLDDLERLHERTGMPIATGENLYGAPTFQRYVESPAIALLQPDVSKNGGITSVVDAGRRAQSSGTLLGPHCYSGAVSIAATLQVAAALSVVEWVEMDIRENPLRSRLTTLPLSLERGCLRIPSAPGLGVALDREELERYEYTT